MGFQYFGLECGCVMSTSSLNQFQTVWRKEWCKACRAEQRRKEKRAYTRAEVEDD